MNKRRLSFKSHVISLLQGLILSQHYLLLYIPVFYSDIIYHCLLFYAIYVASSSIQRLLIMDLHCSLHCAFLLHCPYSLTLVHSFMSSIHILLDLHFDFLPSINPSMMLTNRFRLGLLTIWPKNDDLRLAIFNGMGFSFIRSTISFFVALFILLLLLCYSIIL